MVSPLLPEDVTVTIGGSVLTTQLFEFNETGGETNYRHIKSLGRKHKFSKGVPSDYQVSFQSTVSGSSFDDVFSREDDVQTISLAFSGGITLTYNNTRNFVVNYNMTADDRLVANIEFSLPFYDLNGSQNRVVS